eukprot:689302-Amphidinium_carterae.1
MHKEEIKVQGQSHSRMCKSPQGCAVHMKTASAPQFPAHLNFPTAADLDETPGSRGWRGVGWRFVAHLGSKAVSLQKLAALDAGTN